MGSCKETMRRLVTVLFVLFILYSTNGEPQFDSQKAVESAAIIGLSLWELLSKATVRAKIQQAYDNYPDLRMDVVDPLVMVKKFAIDITDYIEKKVEAVKRIGLAAEESSLDYFKKGRTKQNTGPPMSFVHIPDEIEKSPELNDTLKWSKSLDRVFSDNKKADP